MLCRFAGERETYHKLHIAIVEGTEGGFEYREIHGKEALKLKTLRRIKLSSFV